MAGRRKKTIEEQISLLDDKIDQIKGKLDDYTEKANAKIKSLESKKQSYIEQQQSEQVKTLYNMMQEKGLSIAELESLIQEK